MRETCFHCGGNAQRLVNPAEIVVHEVERDGGLMVLDFLGERIGQASESAHRHAHCQVLTLHIRQCQILHKIFCSLRATITERVGNHQLGICVDCRPRPNVSPLTIFLPRDVPRLRSHETPNLIALDALGTNVPHVRMVVGVARLTQVVKQLQYRGFGITA
jgi:hypothetical protein